MTIGSGVGRRGRHTIEKTFDFAASHELRNLPAGHKCARNHGHNYTVTVMWTADELDSAGMVTDFGDFAPLGRHLADTFDHRLLNDIVEQPTSECLAEYLGQWVIEHLEPTVRGRLVSLRVCETSASGAVWERM
ncbi:6-pyruvoyl trahydropterin synthase family protein [Nocardia terpenica]|uniref:6-carboxy-5,6,7,8-tetrahydropterin synthase n=1 Tax=Nocardia terpenica TaxID=455432 RepID=A0A6G9Z9G8_9NOCA|nr:6-carboxytetrahydropterin synthase [Nocardia terpenica]QIS22178.1 6-carboxytetrahydropterin synthase QueD [Nocardia terpenica]